MKIADILHNPQWEIREESKLTTAVYNGHTVIIKKPAEKTAAQKERAFVSFLNTHHFNTYHIRNNNFEDADEYIIYDYIEGIDGFHAKRNTAYFYAVGKQIGLLHRLLQMYAEAGHKHTSFIHGDLHSGNIIVHDGCIFIIDFSSIIEDWRGIDLLNIEYEAVYEKNASEKRAAFINGYCEQLPIAYPDKDYVIQKIRENDKNEYERLEKRGWTGSDYQKHLKRCVETRQPTFVPLWLH